MLTCHSHVVNVLCINVLILTTGGGSFNDLNWCFKRHDEMNKFCKAPIGPSN